MKKPTSPLESHAHFVGIGGINMSSLAQWFMAQNWTVSGSDIAESVITQNARRRGVNVKIGQKAANLPPQADLVIRTQAVPLTNPEVSIAKRRGIPIFTNSEFLGRITESYTTIAVAGAHGKSTTTALAALTLIAGGLDPTVIIGTLLKELGANNFRVGKSDFLVLEADEYGKTFLHHSPFISITMNIDAEHLDTYSNLAGVKQSFLIFFERTRKGGVLILNRDDKNLLSLKAKIEKIARTRKLTVVWHSLRDPEAKKIRRAMQLPGDHNVSNALAVLQLAKILRIKEAVALKAIHAYQGSWRRMEYRGKFKVQSSKFKVSADVYDDYAHHPTEIIATLKGFREKFPKKKILCVFQPHQAERLKRLWKEFQDAFALADTTLLIPTYKVAGRDVDHPTYNARKLAQAIQKRHPGKKVFYMEDPKNLRSALTTLLQTMDDNSCSLTSPHLSPKPYTLSPDVVIVMMGAGNIVDYTSELIKN